MSKSSKEPFIVGTTNRIQCYGTSKPKTDAGRTDSWRQSTPMQKTCTAAMVGRRMYQARSRYPWSTQPKPERNKCYHHEQINKVLEETRQEIITPVFLSVFHGQDYSTNVIHDSRKFIVYTSRTIRLSALSNQRTANT